MATTASKSDSQLVRHFDHRLQKQLGRLEENPSKESAKRVLTRIEEKSRANVVGEGPFALLPFETIIRRQVRLEKRLRKEQLSGSLIDVRLVRRYPDIEAEVNARLGAPRSAAERENYLALYNERLEKESVAREPEREQARLLTKALD